MPKKPKFLSRFSLPQSKKGRAIMIAGTLIVLLGGLLAVPATRYSILGHVIKRSTTIEILDNKTQKPVSDAKIVIHGQNLKTNAKGLVTVPNIPVGKSDISVDKKYYNLLNANIHVPIFGKAKPHRIHIVAIGNQVTVKVINKLTGKPIAKAGIAALGTTATTDANGEAVIVLPAKKVSEPGAIKLSGYNDFTISIQNTEALTAANTFALTPSGKFYFLSKRTGKINVMKSDLDGSNASVVLAGTGREDDTDTVLLATRDWKYLALKAKRDSDLPKLYSINTATDKLDVIDEGKAYFTSVGWAGHRFVFTVARTDIKYWEPKQNALKSYDADGDTLKTLDYTEAEGPDGNSGASENLSNIYLIDNVVVYTKQWNIGYYANPGIYSGKKIQIFSSALATASRSLLQEFELKPGLVINAKLYEAKEILFALSDSNGPVTTYSFYELAGGGKVAKTTTPTIDTFNQFYPTYIQSPSGKQTFWYEPRDGKNTIFSGNADGKNSKEIAALSEFTPYGWYSDDYVFVSKKGSELYVAPADLSSAPVKVTDYHKPNFNSNGYGGGYGGF